MNSDAFVLCPRCLKTGLFCPLNRHEDDGRVVCGLCNGVWPDVESLLRELDRDRPIQP